MSENTPAHATSQTESTLPVGTSATILGRALVYGVILAIAIAVVGSVLGYLIAGTSGLLSALVGAVVTALFMGFTALSILVAARVTRNDATSVLFFGVILGFWIFKFIAFILIVVLLRTAPWVNPLVMFVSILAAVIGSLVVDVLAFVKTRVPYVDDAAIVTPKGSSSPQ